MKPPSIRRQLIRWVIGALGVGAPALVLCAYLITLGEIDETLDDSLRQTALLLADRDLAGAFPVQPAVRPVPYGDTESMMVALARRTDGELLFTSQPEVTLRFATTPGTTVQVANGTTWHVFTVVQSDRTVQVAQPTAARHEVAAESASQLLVPLFALTAMIGVLLVFALRRGMEPLRAVNTALGQRSETSLAPLELRHVPVEVLPLVQTLNDLLRRLSGAFEAQRHFVADAAHELRSPVTALQLQVQLLERCTDPAEQAAATAELALGIGRMRHLIEQLLHLSRAAAERDQRDPAPLERVNLGDLARAAVVRWSAQAERRHIDLGADIQAAASVEGNPLQLEIALNNLVDNALRYTPPGGVVDVVVGMIAGAPALRVIDDGPGVAPDERVRVFDRFYRSPQAPGLSEVGSGLGLAIVKAISDQHHAVVSLHTGRDGTGLEVRIAFPAWR
jgi:two-component system, OmpR family, sensor kinase